MTRVFLIAESVRRRDSLEAQLESRAIHVAGSAATLEQAEEEWPYDEDVDVVVVDAGREPIEELLGTLREKEWLRNALVLLLADTASTPSGSQAIRSGVRGILPTNAGGDLLVTAIAAVTQGLAVMQPEQFLAAPRTSGVAETEETAEFLEPLTSREKEVLRMLAEGLGNKQIAARLQISEHTAKFHVASIFGKFAASSRAEAVAIGMRRGLILL